MPPTRACGAVGGIVMTWATAGPQCGRIPRPKRPTPGPAVLSVAVWPRTGYSGALDSPVPMRLGAGCPREIGEIHERSRRGRSHGHARTGGTCPAPRAARRRSSAVNTGAMRVGVIGDCPLYRHGLSQLVGTAPDLHLVVTTPSIEGADDGLRGAQVILMDLQQSPTKLVAAVVCLRERGHAVIVVSSSPQIDAVQVIQAGASGYLSRQAEGHELLTAIRVVGAGRSYVSAPASHLLRRSPHFTDREQEILGLLANGATDQEIASQLRISKHTVHSHLDRIGEKTGSRRRPDLTRLAIENGLTDPA